MHFEFVCLDMTQGKKDCDFAKSYFFYFLLNLIGGINTYIPIAIGSNIYLVNVTAYWFSGRDH